MPGIYGVWSNKNLEIKKLFNYFYSSTMDDTINEEYEYKDFIYGRSVLNKFNNDRVVFENSEIIIVLEGLIFNKKSGSSSETIYDWYLKFGPKFVEKIKGQFSGFIYDKKIDNLYIFNDHLSTKPIYYFKNDSYFIFASELKFITKLQSDLNIKKELNYDAVYSILTFGYMLDDITYEKNTKKLKYASIINMDEINSISVSSYYKYKKNESTELTKKEIINRIDDLLIKSVSNCWKKNKEYNYPQYAFLSGGLDSRVNIFLAKEQGYKNVNTITFSQANSNDEKIARKISEQEGYNHKFFSLNNGSYLEGDLLEYVLANDGLVSFQGAAAGFNLLKNNKFSNLGGLHTGQIGDVLFGSFVKDKFEVQHGMMSNRFDLLEKISFVKEFKARYRNLPELFSFEQRQQNNTLNGDRSYSFYTDLISPFYDRDLINFCLNIPDKYKRDEAIYLNWFNEKHKSISAYIWEKAGVKPKYLYIVKLGRFLKKYKNGLLRRLGFNINSMNPFDIWLRKNPKIVSNMDEKYFSLIDAIEDERLKTILSEMYHSDYIYSHYGRNNKFLVLTVLLAYQLHFRNER